MKKFYLACSADFMFHTAYKMNGEGNGSCLIFVFV